MQRKTSEIVTHIKPVRALKNTLNFAGLLSTIGILFPLTLHAQTTKEDAPVNKAGEEIFGADFVPTLATEKTEPLRDGNPHAGASLFTWKAPETEDTKKPIGPELRSVRKEKKLRRWKFDPKTMSSDHALVHLAAPTATKDLKVHFVDVGQGAGAILEFPCHTAIIDSGGQYGAAAGGELFEAYLDKFFNERPERNRTIDVIFTSHPHADHLNGLEVIKKRRGSKKYTIKNVVDNGQTLEKGKFKEQKDFRDWAIAKGAKYNYVNVSSIKKPSGITSDAIDPIGMCGGVDPKITALWGSYNEKVRPKKRGYSWNNPNNHSLVLRVDYGESSLLFLGDLEDTGSNLMLKEYEENLHVFDVGVYHVSHHGAGNDTTDKLIRAMSPEYAILSMGKPVSSGSGSAWAYGHPRKKAINKMQRKPDIVEGTRSPVSRDVATGQRKFEKLNITKAIFGTGWQGTTILRATANGEYEIMGNNP